MPGSFLKRRSPSVELKAALTLDLIRNLNSFWGSLFYTIISVVVIEGRANKRCKMHLPGRKVDFRTLFPPLPSTGNPNWVSSKI